MPFDVEMPDGTVIEDVPDGTTKAQIMAKYQAHQQGPSFGERLLDIAKSGATGLAKGVTGLVGLPGTLANPNETEQVEGLGGEPITVNKGAGRGVLPTTQGLDRIISQPFGGYHEPTTTAGQLTERAAEFAPSVFGGPASLGTRVMGRVLAPAAGSVAAENLVNSENPAVRAGAQTAGALLGAGAFGGARAIGQGFRNARLSPEEVAQGYAAEVARSAGVTPGGTLPNLIEGRGQTAAEALGPVGVAHLATLGRRGGETAPTLAQMLQGRAAEAPGRILSDFESVSGVSPEASLGNMQDIVQAGRVRAAPLYDEAYEATANTSPHLERLASDPDVRKGMALAIKNDQRRAIGANEPFDPNAYAVTGFNKAGDPIVGAVPSWRAWDAAKRGLDETLEGYRDPITRQIKKTDTSDAIDALRRGVISATDAANPAYAAARAAGADYLSANSAFQQGGQHILNTRVTARQAQQSFEKLNEANQQAYMAGIANKLYEQAQNSRLKPNQLLTPATQDKLRTVLGPDRGQTFIDGLQQELSLAQSGQRLMPGTGSITSDVLNAAKEQDLSDTVRGASHFARAAGDVAANRYGSAIANLLRGGYHFAPDMFRTGGMSEAARNEAGRMLMLPPEDFARTLQTLPPPRPSMGAAALAPYLMGR